MEVINNEVAEAALTVTNLDKSTKDKILDKVGTNTEVNVINVALPIKREIVRRSAEKAVSSHNLPACKN